MKKDGRKAGFRAGILPCIVIGLFAFVLYANALKGSFVWDDEVQILRNPLIRSWRNLPAAFASPFWSFALSGNTKQTNYYRPIQTVSYMVGYQLGGVSPFMYHVISVTFHAATCIFLYLVCIELAFARRNAFLVTALFAAHPVHTEAVSWIAAMPDVSCASFYIASMWAFIRFLNSGNRRWVIGSSAFFLGALLCKEMAITLPIVLFLIGVSRGSERRKSEVAWKLLPYGVVLGIYLVSRYAALGVLAASHTVAEASLLDWITLAFAVFGKYLRYSIVPYPLVAYHMIPIHTQDRLIETVIGLAALLTIGTILRATWKYAATEVAWLPVFVVTLIPVFFFKGISGALFAERYLYIPTLALAIAFVATLHRFYRKGVKFVWIVVAAYAAITVSRNPAWRDSETLYTRTLQDEPRITQFHNSLGDIHLKKGNDADARAHLERALMNLDDQKFVQPFDERYRTYIGLGAVAARAGEYVAAKDYLKRALDVNPAGDWAFLYLGGIAMEADSDYPEAIRLFRKAIELGPVNEVARDYLGIAFVNIGNYAEAVKSFEDALRINPTYEDARDHLDIARKALRQ